MIPLEDLDPELLDQTIRQLLARRTARPNPAREGVIADKLSQSVEMMEWADMVARAPVPSADAGVRAISRLMTAISIGLEVGYELGSRERLRSDARKTA